MYVSMYVYIYIKDWKRIKCSSLAREGASSGGGLFAPSAGASSGGLFGGEATRKGSEKDVRHGILQMQRSSISAADSSL